MLKKIKITPLAAESMGARSMCTLVETPDISVLLDAGVSLAPYRYNLLPHPIEFRTIARLRDRISKEADKAQVVTISHYHFDHHTPSYEDWLVNWTHQTETAKQIYIGKQVLVKNPREKINSSQRERAWMFQKTAGRYAKSVENADAQTFQFGNTLLRFSEPVPHGSDNTELGWVIMTIIEHSEEIFIHASDVQGPISNRTADLIKSKRPDTIMISGPPLYLEGFKVDEKQIERGLHNLKSIIEVADFTILEHHALRDENWRQKTQSLFELAEESGHHLVSAAEYLGQENLFLEFKRKQLYAESPPSPDFIKWTRVSEERISHIKPPIS